MLCADGKQTSRVVNTHAGVVMVKRGKKRDLRSLEDGGSGGRRRKKRCITPDPAPTQADAADDQARKSSFSWHQPSRGHSVNIDANLRLQQMDSAEVIHHVDPTETSTVDADHNLQQAIQGVSVSAVNVNEPIDVNYRPHRAVQSLLLSAETTPLDDVTR